MDELRLMVSRVPCTGATTHDGDAAAAAAISASRLGEWSVVPQDPKEVMHVQSYICCVGISTEERQTFENFSD
jgi:hypothetical protein